ncbi:MAG: glycoside hydrolase family 5 protein [Bacteroidetes bacterium]|nr:glycoside hydrolase family 5 protein [Bacteroidota bacterium]
MKHSLSRKIPVFFILPLLLFCNSNTTSSEEKDPLNRGGIPSPVSVTVQNQSLKTGINMGNMLEAPAEGEWGLYLKESEYFPVIKAAGFSHVRVPIRFSTHALKTEPYTINESFLKTRIDKIILAALDNGLSIIINIHHYDELFTDPAANKSRFLAIWKQLGARYKNLPKEVYFEILNEPHDKLTPTIWNDYLGEALTVIRAENPNRTVLVGTAEWGGASGVTKLVLPNDQNLIVTIHYYNPFDFTHQGAEWVTPVLPVGRAWPEGNDAANLENEFKTLSNWAIANNRPVHIGEFGAYSKGDLYSRYSWTLAVRTTSQKYGFSCAYWEFASGFGAYNATTGEWDSSLLLALIGKK